MRRSVTYYVHLKKIDKFDHELNAPREIETDDY